MNNTKIINNRQAIDLTALNFNFNKMVKLKFNQNTDSIDLIKGKDIITTFNNQEFGELLTEMRKMIESVNPKLGERRERKERIKNLKNNLKILLTIKIIDFKNKINKWIKKN